MTTPGANDDRLRIAFRKTTVKAGDAPYCDDICTARWGDLPHMHVKTEGIDDPTPWFGFGVYCSCGAELDRGKADARELDDPLLHQPAPEEKQAAMLRHFLDAHGLDVLTNKDWQRRFTTPPGTKP